MATMARTIYQQTSHEEAHAQLQRVVEELREPLPQAAAMLEDAGPGILAYTGLPEAHWQRLWSNNPLERLNKEIRRRTDVVGAYRNRPAARRLVGAVLSEQHDERAETRHYLTIPNVVGINFLPEAGVLQAAD